MSHLLQGTAWQLLKWTRNNTARTACKAMPLQLSWACLRTSRATWWLLMSFSLFMRYSFSATTVPDLRSRACRVQDQHIVIALVSDITAGPANIITMSTLLWSLHAMHVQ
jgi:hypothetical protein